MRTVDGPTNLPHGCVFGPITCLLKKFGRLGGRSLKKGYRDNSSSSELLILDFINPH